MQINPMPGNQPLLECRTTRAAAQWDHLIGTVIACVLLFSFITALRQQYFCELSRGALTIGNTYCLTSFNWVLYCISQFEYNNGGAYSHFEPAPKRTVADQAT